MSIGAVQPANQQIALVDPATGKLSTFGLQFLTGLVTGVNSAIDQLNGSTDDNNITTAQIGGNILIAGSGSPQGVVTAGPGAIYINTAGGAGVTFWVKESGSDNQGWTAR